MVSVYFESGTVWNKDEKAVSIYKESQLIDRQIQQIGGINRQGRGEMWAQS